MIGCSRGARQRWLAFTPFVVWKSYEEGDPHDFNPEGKALSTAGTEQTDSAPTQSIGPDTPLKEARLIQDTMPRPSWGATDKDPVCGMEVPTGDNPISAAHGGARFFFCSEDCRRQFLEKPDEYAHRFVGGSRADERAGARKEYDAAAPTWLGPPERDDE